MINGYTIIMLVFISYAREDQKIAISIYNLIESHGFSPWMDNSEILPGQNWELEIEQAIKRSNVFIACLSTKSVNKNGFVQFELKKALEVLDTFPEDRVFIIPIRLEPSCEIPRSLENINWLDYFEEDAPEKLIEALSYHIPEHSRKFVPTSVSFIEPELCSIPAGEFLMGDQKNRKFLSVSERPAHRVFISEFCISKYPITNLEYQAFVMDTRHRTPPHWQGINFPSGKNDSPVVNVSWLDAESYCKWLSERTAIQYRIPTEAEWEKAARGDQGFIYPWGNRWRVNRCNSKEMGKLGTTPVTDFSPAGDGSYGVADLIGNVWEWCADWYDENEYSSRSNSIVKNPLGPQKGTMRVLRGGSYTDSKEQCNCIYRAWNVSWYIGWFYGFRIAMSN